MKQVTWSHKLSSAIIGTLLLFSSGMADADQTPEITVVTELFDRFQLIDHNNVLTGYSVEVVESLFHLTGENPEIEIYPWSVAYQNALDKPNVMIFSIARNIEREVQFQWIGRLHHEPIYFWSLSSLNIPPVDSLEAIKNFTVAVVKDANSHRYLVNHQFSNIYLMTSTFSNIDTRSRLKMLNGERAHMVIASEHDILNTIKGLKLERYDLTKVFHDPSLDNDLHIAFSRKTAPEIVKKYRKAFQQLQSKGVIKRIRQKWKMDQGPLY